MNEIKKMLLLFAAMSSLIACTNEKRAESSDVMAEASPAVTLPYVASYSSSFEIGNPAYAQMIVQGSWKDWEENNLDNMVNWVADTIVAYHSDNTVINGVDNLMARWKENRATYTSVNVNLQAVVPTHSIDKNEDWVLVWATEIDTKSDGSVDTVSLMESWRINKGGKADMLVQFDRRNRKK
ncbi:MAG: hypothetical protein OEV74_20940 [Cyclobacteriaceae bacterium]|nr:hypothetical protein [Cyclobacteriaceae bacterium]MDH4298751.1 hypothetical protein [Cyclobacteriaceae bacterium]MDH5249515.1 hypothetical protein [Cyclobacteriaceae bacterium]